MGDDVKEGFVKDSSKLPLLEMLSSILTITRSGSFEEDSYHDIRTNIITFLVIIIIKHVDAANMLAESKSLALALIRLLSRDTNYLWNSVVVTESSSK